MKIALSFTGNYSLVKSISLAAKMVLQAIAEQWQPFRSWAGLLLRNV